jgi:hypothetical protein
MEQKRAQNTKNLFDCALIYFVDKFGIKNMAKASEKIFIWAYSLRLQTIRPQDVTFDNYALGNPINNVSVNNRKMFAIIKNAIVETDVLNIRLDTLNTNSQAKVEKIVDKFTELHYYEDK